MHKSLDEFEIWPDAPLVSMATDRVTVGKTASSRFLERFSYLLVTMIYIRTWMSSKFCEIREPLSV